MQSQACKRENWRHTPPTDFSYIFLKLLVEYINNLPSFSKPFVSLKDGRKKFINFLCSITGKSTTYIRKILESIEGPSPLSGAKATSSVLKSICDYFYLNYNKIEVDIFNQLMCNDDITDQNLDDESEIDEIKLTQTSSKNESNEEYYYKQYIELSTKNIQQEVSIGILKYHIEQSDKIRLIVNQLLQEYKNIVTIHEISDEFISGRTSDINKLFNFFREIKMSEEYRYYKMSFIECEDNKYNWVFGTKV